MISIDTYFMLELYLFSKWHIILVIPIIQNKMFFKSDQTYNVRKMGDFSEYFMM